MTLQKVFVEILMVRMNVYVEMDTNIMMSELVIGLTLVINTVVPSIPTVTYSKMRGYRKRVKLMSVFVIVGSSKMKTFAWTLMSVLKVGLSLSFFTKFYVDICNDNQICMNYAGGFLCQ